MWMMVQNVKKYSELSKLLSGKIDEDWFKSEKKIAKLKGGNFFLQELQNFLKTYGHRSPKYEISHKTWIEEPKMVIELMNQYIQNELPDPKNGEKRQSVERKKTLKKCLATLSFFKRYLFKKVVKNAQIYFQQRENQQFYIMMQLPISRRLLLEIGKRLVAKKKIKKESDIFFFTPKEIVSIISKLNNLPFDLESYRENTLEIVEKRKSEMQAFQAMNPPVYLGLEKKEENNKNFDKKNIIKGIPASKGKVIGRVKIILTPDNFNQLKKGEILVTPATTPAWTPLFGIVSGLITDYGGLLSHSGVVAREYGLPAVVGTSNATQVLKDGDTVSLNGETGDIIIL